ncbi:hypothetical protein [Usitatibacter palustris]|uniref:Uncharacterized protein n=1 Tax=Usitatibacter palustris TaxID=2732487 RepID=A0A6M4H5E6_9PROT|nr:hypothetical protein [Usitatibacter palustris]QJR14512.1 hypothetical protein DSM104440_01313 [Usitatibacter palustris]
MNVKQTVVTGALTIMAFGVFALLPANADSIDNPQASAAATTVVALNSAETPQEQVWDMTYGGERAAPAYSEIVTADELPYEQVSDVSFG